MGAEEKFKFPSLLKELPEVTFSFFLWTLLASTYRTSGITLKMKLAKKKKKGRKTDPEPLDGETPKNLWASSVNSEVPQRIFVTLS